MHPNTTITKWVHINEIGGDPWVRPIWGAVIEAVRAGKLSALPKSTMELGLHISTRLSMLPNVINRVNAETKTVFLALKNSDPKYVSSKGVPGYAFPIADDLKYSLLTDIDSLLFELNSACDLMCDFVKALYSHVRKPIRKSKVGPEIVRILKSAGHDPCWFRSLDSNRNFFMHEGAPYIAVDVSIGDQACDLIIMKQNLKTFDDPKKFIMLSELDKIVRGFVIAKKVIQNRLVNLYREIL